MVFIGIQFAEVDGGGLALVHQKWLTPRKRETWWPPYKQQEHFDKSLKKGESPTENWKLYKVERSFFEADDYKRALQKLKKAEVTSDITSGDETMLPKRVSVPPKKLLFGSDDEEEDLSQHPLPTRISGIAHLLKRRRITSTYNEKEVENSESIAEDVVSIDTGINKVMNNKDNESCISNVAASSLRETPKSEDKSIDYSKKILNLLLQIKAQNSEIIDTLQHNKVTSELCFDLTKEVPVRLPLQHFADLTLLEEYLDDNKKVSALASYCATLGGRDIVNKTNIILKHLISNKLAAEYSFLGSRNDKRTFQVLKLRKVVLNAVLSTCSTSTEAEVDSAIKVWLKHAPKRLKNQEKREAAP